MKKYLKDKIKNVNNEINIICKYQSSKTTSTKKSILIGNMLPENTYGLLSTILPLFILKYWGNKVPYYLLFNTQSGVLFYVIVLNYLSPIS